MLRGACHRRPRAAPAADRRGPVRDRAAPGGRAGPDACVHRERVGRPRRAAAAAARVSRRDGQERELGARAVPARRARRGTFPVRRRGRPRHARRGRLAGGGGRRRRHREAVAGTGRRPLGTRQPALGALPARLRGRAARDRGGGRARAGRARAPGGGALVDAGRRDHGEPRRLRARFRAAAAGTGRSTVDAALLLPLVRGALPLSDPRVLATVDAVRAELGVDGYMYRFRHDDRPLDLAEGAFLLCGLLDGARGARVRRPGGGGALVRAEPECLRARRAVHRGVRRAPAAAAGQRAAGVRARRGARVRGDAVHGTCGSGQPASAACAQR